MRKIASDRVVIKIGTSTLTTDEGHLNEELIATLAATISELKQSGKQVILVTSGAIGAGRAKLGLNHRPTLIPEKQAVAAVGQSLLMGVYDKYFGDHDIAVGQILITKNCIENTNLYGNAINTLNTLLNMNIVPIVNENDTIAVDEIIFGDNDTLAAHVATMTNANLLIILSDIDGLYDRNPSEEGAKLLLNVGKLTEELIQAAGDSKSDFGTGGMRTKITAAKIASLNGTNTVIMNGTNPEKIKDLLEGAEIGTYFDLRE